MFIMRYIYDDATIQPYEGGGGGGAQTLNVIGYPEATGY